MLSLWDFIVFEEKFLHLLGVFMRFAASWMSQVFSVSSRRHSVFELANPVKMFFTCLLSKSYFQHSEVTAVPCML